MKNFEAAYVPIGVGTFHMESAEAEFEESKKLLAPLCDNIKIPDRMLLDVDTLDAWLDTLAPDLIILQNLTFANAAYASHVLARFSCPVVLWALREPAVDGGRLRLNSLTGSFSAGNAFKSFRKENAVFVFGSPSEEGVRRKIKAAFCAAEVRYKMKNLKMAQIGHPPEGFGFGRALDCELLANFGVSLEAIEARELINEAKACPDEEAKVYLDDACRRINGLSGIDEKNVMDFARLYKAYAEYVNKHEIGALATRCWPDFFVDFGTPVCAVISILNDLGIASACEADIYGALSMYIGQELSGRSVFFGDPASMDEKEGTITFWHCGMAPCSLARENTGACAGLHCNRNIGPTLEFGCRPQEAVTVFRVGRTSEGKFRFFIEKGRALDRPKQFYGTSVVVQTETPPEIIVNEAIRAGFEPHFAVIFADVHEELEILADMLGMEIWSV